MKRFGLALGAGCLMAFAATGVASASYGGFSDSYLRTHDYVFGAIKRTSLDGTIDQRNAIAAFQTPTGATGIYVATYDGPTGKQAYTGRVTCINVVGASAMVGIQILTSTRADAIVGTGEFIRVTDYGATDTQKDSISPGVFTPTPQTVCPTPVMVHTPTYAGAVIVHDGGL